MNFVSIDKLKSNQKCHVQIMEESLTTNKAWEIDDNTFLRTENEYHLCLKLLWTEERFNIVSDNFYEWEQEIKKSYDFLIENQNEHPDCDTIMQTHGAKEIVILNRRLFNVLNSIRMYRDQVLHDLSDLDNQMKCKFEEETHRQYDRTFSYQIMEFLRNFIQHQGLIIERITATIPFSKKLNNELWYYVEANYPAIEKIEKYKKKIKNPPTSKMEWLNLIVVMREYYSQIIELHNYFRRITEERYKVATQYLSETIESVYGNLPVKSVAFFGKENQNDFQDFLLQMEYLERLRLYRNKNAVMDESQFYISKKTYLESDKIRVSNSVTCRFRYNK